MADGGRQDVLGQKAQAAQRAFEARGMSPAKALRRAFSRSADVLWDLALVTQGVQQEMLDQDGVIDALSPDLLLLLLDGPDSAVGIAAVDREILTGVVEVQTIQQVTTMPVEERALTSTDAAMIAPLIDGALQRFAENLVDHPLRPQFEGYRFGAMIEDARAASLLLDAASYRSFQVTLDLALGRRKGQLSIVLPERKIERTVQDQDRARDMPGPHAALMQRLPVRLDTVLSRFSLPLNKAQALKPGDLLPLPGGVLDEVSLMAGNSQLVARGRLGQLNGMRAVRINWPKGAPAAAPEPASAAFSAPPEHEPAQHDKAIVPAAAAPAAMEEPLPDLPPLDFDAGDMDFDMGSFDAEPSADADDTGLEDGFAAAPLSFDFEE